VWRAPAALGKVALLDVIFNQKRLVGSIVGGRVVINEMFQFCAAQQDQAQDAGAPRCLAPGNAVQYSTVLYSAVQCSAVQCSAAQLSTVQHSTVQYSKHSCCRSCLWPVGMGHMSVCLSMLLYPWWSPLVCAFDARTLLASGTSLVARRLIKPIHAFTFVLLCPLQTMKLSELNEACAIVAANKARYRIVLLAD